MTPLIDTPTILIVDDTPSNLGVVVDLFESRGYRVAIAQDGEEGLQRAQLVQPDLILLDVMMPGIDGFETCRRLKAQQSTRDIPVIFMTALAATEHKINGFDVGAVDYVTKPLQIDEIMARVDTHLKLHAAQKRLKEQNAQLDEQREELEQRVAERTEELAVSNLQLRVEIAERVKAQEELAIREREFRTLAENAPDNIVRHDSQCRFLYVNRQYEKSMGVAAENIIGRTPMEDFPETPDVADYQARMMAVIETGLPDEFEAALPDKGEGPRYHNIRLAAERDADGNVAGVLAIGRDITERKRAEQRLAMLGAAISQVHEAAYFVDDQARIFYVNEEASRQLGYSCEEFLAMTVMDIAPGWTAEVVVSAWQSLGEGGASTFEAEHRRKDGSIVPVEINVSHLKHDGKAFGLAMVRDITERKRMEQAILIREAELRSVTDSSPYSIIRYDIDGRMTYVNAPLLGYFGLPLAELVGKLPREVWPDERFAEIERGLASVRETEQSVVVEYSETTADGEVLYHQVTIVPERGASGEMAGIIAFGLNITTRKQAEEALREREQRYRGIFDNVLDTLYLLEVTPEGRFRNLEVNPAFEKSSGIPSEALIGKFIDETVSEETVQIVTAKYRRCIEAGTTIDEEAMLDLPSGVRHYHSTLVPVRDDSGRIHRIVGISRDITERKHAEQLLEESRTQLRGLAAKNEAVREEERRYIAREVHDELGQVLTGLQLDISMLSYKFGKEMPALHEHLQGTLELVNRSLATARNVATTLRPGSLDMGIVSAIEWLVERYGKNTGIHCEVHIRDEERGLELEENASIALFRIAQESLTNVARHAQASKVDISIGQEGEDYLLEIRDNGNGFDSATAKEGSFGLVGIRERVYMLGGKLEIVSKPGSGTVIRVRIPGHNFGGGK